MSTPLTTQMDKADATALTRRIRTAVDDLWEMLLEAHDRKAWKVLGYATWEAYVTTEFSMSRRHSYRLLDQGRVINAVRRATGVLCPSGSQNRTGRGRTRTLSAPSANIDISERDARDLKPDLPAVTEEIKGRVEAGEDPKKAVDETIAAKRAAKEKAKAEKHAKQAEYDREREEHLAKLPDAVKRQQAAKDAAIAAKKGNAADAAEEGLSDADRIEELEEAVRVLEAENAELRVKIGADADLYGEMKAQWEAGGYEKVIADKDEQIRVLQTSVYRENEEKVSWSRSAKFWKDQATKLGYSNEAVIDLKTGEMTNG